MLKYGRCLPVVLVLVLFGTIDAQVPAQAPESKSTHSEPAAARPDYSKEAFVDEQDLTKIVFENDGTGTRETSTRIRIQSDAGVQHYGVLTFPYQNAIETIDIDYVRIRKPDGTVITTPAENVQDMPAEITRQAPFYSDLQEKHVAVKGLSVGDVLETQAHWHTTKPLAPGQFWFAFNFSHDFILLDQEVQVSVPRDRAIKWKSAAYKPVISEEGSRRVFTWKYSQLEQKSADEQKKEQEEQAYQLVRGRLPPPDVQISTFQSWEEIGAWYNKLQADRVKPDAEIAAKAAELTKSASDDNARLHAIYNYVSTKFHYIGVAFGIGRYQPHAAAEVLANQYGDCKDKHTLLASLLEAARIKAYPALISASRELDADVPSPAQFDHVITAVPEAKSFVWLDTTAEVAPYGYLLSPLRDKEALVIPAEKPSALVTTPAGPPTKASETFHIDAELKDDGTLEGKVERSVSGDDREVLLRAAFRRVPMPQWKDLIQQISYASGFSGEVSEVSASPPEKTDEPFHFAYTYTRKDFPQWSERRISSPVPPILAAAPDEKPSHPILLGAIGEIRYESRVELPKGYTPQLPSRVDLSEEFAEYHAIYTTKDGALRAERRLLVKAEEVPVSEYGSFKKFSKAVSDNGNLYIALSNGMPSAQALAISSFQGAFQALPDSANTGAVQLEADARAALQRGETQVAIASLKGAVAADPKFARAWSFLGGLLMESRHFDEGVDAFNKAIEVNPGEAAIYKVYGYSLLVSGKNEEAVPIWEEEIKLAPKDADGPLNLASALMATRRYGRAASELEAASKIDPHRPDVFTKLGLAYTLQGDENKAAAAYDQALEVDPRPVTYNDIAYAMTKADKRLSAALGYAEKAVRGEEEASADIKLSALRDEDVRRAQSLASFWGTLGWAHARLSHFNEAERYLSAAWTLSQDGTTGLHLAQLYQRLHRDRAALRLLELAEYRLSFGTGSRSLGPSDEVNEIHEIRALHEHLSRGSAGNFGGIELSKELTRMRTFKLPRLIAGSASAEFFVLLGPNAKIKDARFINGSEKLKQSRKSILSISLPIQFPDGGPTHVVRRGSVDCSQQTGCSLSLLLPGDVNSVN